MPLFRKEGHLLGEANCITSLANIAAARSELESARVQFEEAMGLYEKISDPLGAANCMVGLGGLAREGSDFERAHAHYEAAMKLYQEIGDTLGEGNCLMGLGRIALGRGNRVEAEAKYLQALTIYEHRRQPYSIGCAHELLARVVADDESRCAHVAAARVAWLRIKRIDLVTKLDKEFGTG